MFEWRRMKVAGESWSCHQRGDCNSERAAEAEADRQWPAAMFSWTSIIQNSWTDKTSDQPEQEQIVFKPNFAWEGGLKAWKQCFTDYRGA